MTKLIKSKNKFLPLWIFFHGLIALLFLFSVIRSRGLKFDADLFNMLPDSAAAKTISTADKKVTEKSAQNIFILCSHEDFEKAKESAVTVFEALKDSPKFSSLSLYSDASSLFEIEDFLHDYSFNLLDSKTQELLKSENGAQTFAENAISEAFGFFTVSSLEKINEDPFLLDETVLKNYLAAASDSGTSMSPKDGVLATEFENRWYVMISGIVSKEGAALASKSNAVETIYQTCTPLEKDGIRFVYSGTPFHSYKSSMSASKEISIISTLSLLIVVVMLIFIFRSFVPLAFSLLSILISVGTAMGLSHFVFGKIHMLTLIFGTSLIGCCIDYSLHFFMHWKANQNLKSGSEIRSHLFMGLTLSLISTEICYVLLCFSPFTLLKQMAVFSLSGILSSFLTVLCIYPLLKFPSEQKRTIKLPATDFKILASKKIRLGTFSVLILVSLSLLLIFRENVLVKNSISGLYQMEGRLKDDTILSSKVLNYNPSSWFIVSGKSADEVLIAEESLCKKLEGLGNENKKVTYLSTSRFVPSSLSQKESLESCKNLIPLVDYQCESLGLTSEDAENYKGIFTERLSSQSSKYILSPENPELPSTIKSLLSSVWLGEIDGAWYSLVLPIGLNDAECRNLAADFENVYFENKVADISSGLDHLTKQILVMFDIAFLGIVIFLKFFYTWKQTISIALIPIFSVLAILAVFAAIGRPIDFFAITGMILVFGMGLDYIIYMVENSKRKNSDGLEKKLEPLAVALSFFTTVISFGALALSSFVPVHVIGLSIFVGLTAAFTASFCLSEN